MKVVVGLSAVLPFTGWPLLTGSWLLNSIILIAFNAGDQTKMDRSFPSCTTEHVHQQRQNGCFRDGIQHSNRVWICCCSLMKSWLIMFFQHKICTRPIGRLVSQFYSSLGCFYQSGTTGQVVSSNTALWRHCNARRTVGCIPNKAGKCLGSKQLVKSLKKWETENSTITWVWRWGQDDLLCYLTQDKR